MSRRHPALPQEGLVASGHRAGNTVEVAMAAIDRGIDLIETDIWYRHGNLEIRHQRRLGWTPFYWESGHLSVHIGRQLHLREILRGTPETSLLFLDLKGEELELGPAIVEEIATTSPGRIVAVCGRNYPQIDLIVNEPGIVPFYSVGKPDEWESAWPRLKRMAYPAVSLHADLATEATMTRLKDMGATVVCWAVDTAEQACELAARGVDGFTSDSTDLLQKIYMNRTI